ncbi:MAG: Uma2 family endonuclease, partial [Hyphomicrobiales bacterium]|nr:Uma2 family endonuclease [Hyphomicrobiales bacterium]
MNERFQPDLVWPATTQAADGMPRRPWSVAEIEAMVAAGIIRESERFELIGGEVVPMSPKGARHEMVKIDLNEHLQRIKAPDLRVGPETTLRLDD